MDIRQTQYAPKSTIIRQFIQEHMSWVEAVLQTPASALMQLRLDVSLAGCLSSCLPGADGIAFASDLTQRFALEVLRVEVPPGLLPAVSLGAAISRNSLSNGKRFWTSEWLDCPVALHLRELQRPVVVMHVPYVAGGQSAGEWREIVILAAQDAAAFLRIVEDAFADSQTATVDVLGLGIRSVAATRWDDLVLDAATHKLLRDDFTSFFEREEWFRANKLPYRRGYLLHGPPGNGKSSAIRAMLSHPGIHGHTVNLLQRGLDDNDLMAMFHRAAAQTPALIVLEDLDRCFTQAAEGEDYASAVHLQTLLNCMDGITTQDGVVIVATANDATVLDPAILRRPGRFDRVVEFTNPSAELRSLYLQRLAAALSREDLDACIEASEGSSFAQLRESYILAGQSAFAEDREIRGRDILQAMAVLQASVDSADWKRTKKSGFRARNPVESSI